MTKKPFTSLVSFHKRLRKSKLFAPLKCSKCGVVLELGDTYWARRAGCELCTGCYEEETKDHLA